MGKGRIIDNLGAGKYLVELVYNTDRADKQIDELQKQIKEIEDKIAELEPELNDAQSKLDTALQDLEDAIESGEQDKIEKAQKLYLEAYNNYIKLEYQYDHQRAQKASKQKRIDTLKKNLPENKQVEAWCTDYSTSLSGEVGTIESVTGNVIIQPGFEGSAEYDSKRDGQLTPIMSQTPAGAFYNAAMRPGWQKWKPLYRTARITSVDKENDTCSLVLEPQGTENVAQSGNVYVSELQDLIIDHRIFWDLVPIDYMDCDAKVFYVNAEVVLRFQQQNPNDPEVIGFVRNPLECAPLELKGATSVVHGETFVLTDNWQNRGNILIDRPPNSQNNPDSDGAITFLGYEQDEDGINTGYKFRMGSSGDGTYNINCYYGSEGYSECDDYSKDTHLVKCGDSGTWITLLSARYYPGQNSFEVKENYTDRTFPESFQPTSTSDVFPYEIGSGEPTGGSINNWCDYAWGGTSTRRQELAGVYKMTCQINGSYSWGGENGSGPWTKELVRYAQMNIDDGFDESDCNWVVNKYGGDDVGVSADSGAIAFIYAEWGN